MKHRPNTNDSYCITKPASTLHTPISKLNLGDYIIATVRKNDTPLESNLGYVRDLSIISKFIQVGITDVVIRKLENHKPIIEVSNKDVTISSIDSAIYRIMKSTEQFINSIGLNKGADVTDLQSTAKDIVQQVAYTEGTFAVANLLKNTDNYLFEHSFQVGCLLIAFGQYLGFKPSILEKLAIGGLIHDIGKTQLDINILNKEGKLTKAEFEHIKNHQHYAIDLLPNISNLDQIAKDVCLMHHEKLDGTGYPHGLFGEHISIYGRMAAIVDIYDALTAERSYKKGMTPSVAFKLMLTMTPHHLDKELVYKFINCIGIYPEGSIVALTDGNQAIVWKKNQNHPLQPTVILENPNSNKLQELDLSKESKNIHSAVEKNDKNERLRTLLAQKP